MKRATTGSAYSVSNVAADDPRWLAFVELCRPTLFQSPSWGALVEAVYGFRNRVAVAESGGGIVTGLPYAEVEDFRGPRMVAQAFADVCEPLGDADAWPAIETALAAGDVPWQIRSRVRPGTAATDVTTVGMHQFIPLRCTAADAFARCHPKLRANVRQARAAGIECRVAVPDEGIGLFYAMHANLRKSKHRLLPQPRRFFEELARRYFPDRGFVFVAWSDRTPIAAMVFLREGDTWYYKFSASQPDALALRPNHLLLWHAAEMAIEAGLDGIDLGISEDEGLVLFKQRFGAQSAPVFAGKYLRREKSADVLAVEATLSALTNRLTEPDAPIEAALAGGNVLYRYFV